MNLGGKTYDLAVVSEEEVVPGQLIRPRAGYCVRRIVGFDGEDVILRGVKSLDVFEAVTSQEILESWYRLVPA